MSVYSIVICLTMLYTRFCSGNFSYGAIVTVYGANVNTHKYSSVTYILKYFLSAVLIYRDHRRTQGMCTLESAVCKESVFCNVNNMGKNRLVPRPCQKTPTTPLQKNFKDNF